MIFNCFEKKKIKYIYIYIYVYIYIYIYVCALVISPGTPPQTSPTNPRWNPAVPAGIGTSDLIWLEIREILAKANNEASPSNNDFITMIHNEMKST